MDSSVQMIDCQNLAPGTLVEVETKSRCYQIESIEGNRVLISGHPDYCPEPVTAWLGGSIAADGSLDFGLIENGRRMMVVFGDGHPVTTSKVQHVRLSRPAAPKSSPNVH